MFILIVLFIIVVIVSLKPKQKSQNEMVQAQNSLPNIYLQERNMGGLLKTLNLAFDDSVVLQYFSYENGVVTLTMKNGATMKAPLSDMEVSYSTYVSEIHATVVAYGRKQKVITYDNFNKHEWEVILRVLALAGRTYGTSFLVGNVDNTQKNIREILKELNRIG